MSPPGFPGPARTSTCGAPGSPFQRSSTWNVAHRWSFVSCVTVPTNTRSARAKSPAMEGAPAQEADAGIAVTARTEPVRATASTASARSLLTMVSSTFVARAWFPVEPQAATTDAPSGSPGGERAELVAVRVGEHRPGNVSLADVEPSGAERDQAIDLRALVVVGVGRDVEVETVLRPLGHAGRSEREERA